MWGVSRLLSIGLILWLAPCAWAQKAASGVQGNQQGLTALFKGKYLSAVRSFQRVLTRPATPDQQEMALFYLGYANEKLGRSQQALAIYAKLREEMPKGKFAAALYRSGCLYKKIRAYRQALDLFETVTAEHRDNHRLALTSNFKAANLKLLIAPRVHPCFPASMSEDVQGAIARYQGTLELCRSAPKTYAFYAGKARRQLGLLKRCQDEREVLPLFLEGMRLKKEGHTAQALTALQELARRYPESLLAPSIQSEIAVCRYLCKRWEGAIEACDTYVKLYGKQDGLPEVMQLRTRASLRQLQQQTFSAKERKLVEQFRGEWVQLRRAVK